MTNGVRGGEPFSTSPRVSLPAPGTKQHTGAPIRCSVQRCCTWSVMPWAPASAPREQRAGQVKGQALLQNDCSLQKANATKRGRGRGKGSLRRRDMGTGLTARGPRRKAPLPCSGDTGECGRGPAMLTQNRGSRCWVGQRCWPWETGELAVAQQRPHRWEDGGASLSTSLSACLKFSQRNLESQTLL